MRENRAEAIIPSIISGQTTKAEVLLTLGEPDQDLGNQFVYHWQKLKFLLLVPGGYHAGGFTVHKECKLIVTFDERGVVSKQKLESDLDWNPALI
jgi:outer membrane protein assembly factor BamE (lipoprotein component of BamABCDE complex)